jgi:hypothetical protein
VNTRESISAAEIIDVSAIATWCQLVGRGGWSEFRAATSELDQSLDAYDVARALAIDCAIDVDFDGNFSWSSPLPSLIDGTNRGGRVIGASTAYRNRLGRSYGMVEVDENFLTVGTRRRTYKYAAVRSLGAPIAGAEDFSKMNRVAAWSLLRSLPSIAKAVAEAEEVPLPADGCAAEIFVVSCETMTFDSVPRSEYRPKDFHAANAVDSSLWRLRSSKSILVQGGRAYRIHDDVGRLKIILDSVRQAGRGLQFDWYASLDEGQLVDVVAIPRVRMPLLFRRALRVAGATYPPFSDSGRLWAVGVDPNLARELAGKLGMTFRKVE